jgi:hypothetical protein
MTAHASALARRLRDHELIEERFEFGDIPQLSHDEILDEFRRDDAGREIIQAEAFDEIIEASRTVGAFLRAIEALDIEGRILPRPEPVPVKVPSRWAQHRLDRRLARRLATTTTTAAFRKGVAA